MTNPEGNPEGGDPPPVTGDSSGEVVDTDVGPDTLPPPTPNPKSKKGLVGAAVALIILVGGGVAIAASSHKSSNPTSANPSANAPVVAKDLTAGYTCRGAQETLFDNTNGLPVDNFGDPPTFNTAGTAYCLTYIQTYHWNNGSGATPGLIGLKRLRGSAGFPVTIGPFPAMGSSGQDGAANVNWFADVPIVKPIILNGTYQCTDSSPGSWSGNSSTAGSFCIVYGDPAYPPGK